MIRRLLIAGNGLLVVGVVLGMMVQKERVLSNGQQVFLELRPVDPRSLIEGDYMRLDYALARQIYEQDLPQDGVIYITLNQNKVAVLAKEGEPEAMPLRYRRRGGQVRIATDAFYFEEGTAEQYNIAKYGEIRLDEGGDSVLVGMRDLELRPLPHE